MVRLDEVYGGDKGGSDGVCLINRKEWITGKAQKRVQVKVLPIWGGNMGAAPLGPSPKDGLWKKMERDTPFWTPRKESAPPPPPPPPRGGGGGVGQGVP